MGNVNTAQFKEYLESFQEVLVSTAEKFLPDHAGELVHLALLPSKITGYVSTNFGVGITYEPSDTNQLEVVQTSSRVEHELLGLPNRARKLPPMFRISGSLTIAQLTLDRCFPELLVPAASLTVVDVMLRCDSWSRKIEYAELYGNRNGDFWTEAQAVARAKDEVLAGLFEVRRSQSRRLSLTEYISSVKQRTILVLGDYSSDGRLRIEKIRQSLKVLNYDTMLVEELPDQPHLDLPQKVALLAGLSRFIVVDDSSKSGHLAEIEICKKGGWVTVLLRSTDSHGSYMSSGASATSNVILERTYSPDGIDTAVKEIAHWAEAKLKELGATYDKIYPWRHREGHGK